jgi:alanine dehydrogenase
VHPQPSFRGRTHRITAFTNAILPYLAVMAERGVKDALLSEPALDRGAVYANGVLKNAAVAELTGEPFEG